MYKCFHCGFQLEKKLEKGHSVNLPYKCPNCKKLAPRQSLRPIMPVRKSKKGK